MSAELFERLQKELADLDEAANLTMTAVFMLPKALTKLLSWVIRKKRVRVEELAEYFEHPVEIVRPAIESLVEKNFLEALEENGETIFQVKLGNQHKPKPNPTTPRKNPWQGFDE